MKLLQKCLRSFLVLQIVLIVSGEKDKENSQQVVNSLTKGEGVSGDTEQLHDVIDEKQHIISNDDVIPLNDESKIEHSNESKDEKIMELSENAIYPHGKVHKLKQDSSKSRKKQKINVNLKKPSAWKFKYANVNKDEPGFDLSPEEMKKFKIWKDGVIPYYIDMVSFRDKVLRDKIRNFLQMVNSITNIKFVELPGPPSNESERWIFFMNRRGLLSCAVHSVRRFTNQGVQQVVLGYDCMVARGEMAEAVMAIVGVPAQHNAPDRDKYIQINNENITPDKKYLFEKLNDNEWLFHDLSYDFNSITHYDLHKYSANGRATIELKKNSEELNPARTFSPTDLLKIKMLYNFITKNNKIQTPVCEKLFKISNKLKQGPEMLNRVKPRRKPSRYSGIPHPAEKLNGDTGNKNDIEKNQNENGKEMFSEDNDEELADEGENSDKESEDDNKDVRNLNDDKYADEDINAEYVAKKEKHAKKILNK